MVLKANDWIGLRFGRLVVTGVTRIPSAGSVVDCVCDCGNFISVKNHNLIKGSTASCGCLWKEKITTHGMTKSRAYVTWKAMRSRCYNPNVHHWHNYGGRGIKVCKRWGKFENFLKDMGEPPAGRTIDRIDKNGNYTPKNCRWATYKEQLNNTRSNRLITAFGKTQSLTLWAEEYKLPVSTLKNRLFRAKMEPEAALTASLYAQQRGVLNVIQRRSACELE